MRTLAAALALIGLAGCAADSTHSARAVTEATPQQRAALIDRVKSLAGTWEATDEKGNKHVASVFTVSSNGSAVREVMLPGTEHEMTNMYTMDGPTLVMTHYCALGNQPKMRAAASDQPGVVELKFDSVGNLVSADQGYMGALTLTMKDPNHLTEHWTHFEKGKAGHDAVFELTRRQ